MLAFSLVSIVRRTGFPRFAPSPLDHFNSRNGMILTGRTRILAGDAVNVNSEVSFQASIKDYHPYPSSKRREPPVLAFGAGATDAPSARSGRDPLGDGWSEHGRGAGAGRTRRHFGLGFILIVVLGLLNIPASAQTDEDAWTKSRAVVQTEIGIDSLQRRFYRPQFTLSWPLAVLGGSRAELDVSYLQRINGSQEGAIDYWVRGGLETRISDTVSFEVSLNHFCRHLTSVLNPYVLNLNELVGRFWVRRDDIELGLGYGPYIGGSRGYDDIMILDFNLPRLLIPELSLETEWKWANFRDVYYDAALSVGLTRGADIFIRATHHYAYPATAYIGLRFRSDGAIGRIVDKLDLEAGVYPYFNMHKLLVSGGYRLEFLHGPERRFFIDVDFRTPILSGSGFLGQFWPDHMLYDIAAQYERTLPGRLYGGWYARYFLDMPVDKALRFRSGLATGLALRNQPDFNRLDKPVRFEIAAGYDFVFAYDLRVRLGAQVKPRGFIPAGSGFPAGCRRRAANGGIQNFCRAGERPRSAALRGPP